MEFIVIFAYFALIIGIGYYFSRDVHDIDDFAVAGRKIVWPVLLASSATSMIGGGASVGTVAKAIESGAGYGICASAWYLSLVYTGIYIAPKLRGLNLTTYGEKFTTVGDLFAHKYGEFSRKWIGLVSFVFCIGIVAAQIVAIGGVLEAITNIPFVYCAIIGTVVVMIYSTLGGMASIMKVDVFQFLLLVFVFTGLAIYGLIEVGGYGALLEQVPQKFIGWTGALSTGKIISLFIAFFLGELLAPYFVQRMYAAKDESAAKYGITGAGLFMTAFLPITMITLGFIAIVTIPDIPADRTALVTLAKHMLPAPVVGLVVAAILACIMSSCSAILSSCSVIATKDFYERMSHNSDKRSLLKVGRISNIVIALISLVFAMFVPDVIDALLYAYAVWAPAAVIPIIYALSNSYSPLKAKGVIVSSILGSIASLGWTLSGQPYGLDAGVLGFLVALIVFIFHPKVEPAGSFKPLCLESEG